MTCESVCTNKYPERYILERETEKTINKLSRVKELKFYLQSPDQYIRRLAILRVRDLKLKDALSMLEEILDNPAESQINKELAAWSIKSICVKWNIELFISNKLIYQFTGREKYHEIYRVNIKDTSPELKCDFAPITSKLGITDDQNLQNQEINIETYFSFQEWLPICLEEVMVSGRQQCISLIKKLLIAGLNKIKSINILSLLKKLGSIMLKSMLLLNVHKGQRSRLLEKRTSASFIERKRINLGTLMSNALYHIVDILFYPIRLIIRHKTCAIAALCILYYFLTFTDAGIFYTKQQFGVSLIELQNNLLHSDLMETRNEVLIVVKKALSVAWLQVKDIADWIYYKWIEEIGVK
ncbi:MAG: hypothetical protein AAGU27_01680 [Dehalobacterium sp.]